MKSESIMDSRKSTIEDLLQVCTKLVDTYINQPRICQAAGDSAKQCDSMVLGSLIRGLSRIGFWPIPGADEVTMSVSALSGKQLGMACCKPQFTTSNTAFTASSTSSWTPSFTPGTSPWGQPPGPGGNGATSGSIFGSPRPVQASSNSPGQSASTLGGDRSLGFGQPSRQETVSAKPKVIDTNSAHENCGFTTSFRADVQYILDNMQSGVLDEHREHLAEQEKKRSTVVPRG